MDDTTIICIRHEFSYTKVLAGTEQDYGDGLDIGGGAGGSHGGELGFNVEGEVGAGGGCGGLEHVVVVDSGGTIGVYI